jgi:hypothetical protein
VTLHVKPRNIILLVTSDKYSAIRLFSDINTQLTSAEEMKCGCVASFAFRTSKTIARAIFIL